MDRRAFLGKASAGAGGVVCCGVAGGTSAGTDQNSSSDVLTTFTATARHIELPPCPLKVMRPAPMIDTRIIGEIYADGTWKSTNVSFPEEFRASDNFACTGWLTTYRASVQNLPMTGTFEPGEQRMTASFGIELRTDVFNRTYETVLTTGTSGEMEGTFTGVSTGVADVTLVSADPDSSGHFKLELELSIADPGALSPLFSGPVPEPIMGNNPPRDLDGDGLYEDVRGDGVFNILDAQALFDTLDTDEVQTSSEKFNFSGHNSDQVTILDVQELFDELRGS